MTVNVNEQDASIMKPTVSRSLTPTDALPAGGDMGAGTFIDEYQKNWDAPKSNQERHE